MSIKEKIKKGFHIIKRVVSRAFAPSLPYLEDQKAYGNDSENFVYNTLKEKISDSYIFRNVCLDENNARGEIDFIIIFENKVFVIELKSWKGDIVQENGSFYQIKKSESGNKYTKKVSSPFKQIDRNVYLIKQKFPHIWFEKAVLFINSDSLNIKDDHIWFTNIDDLVHYIKTFDKCNHKKYIKYLINNIHSYDLITSESLFSEGAEHCIITFESLCFYLKNEEYTKRDIAEIEIYHKIYYDNLFVKLKDGNSFTMKVGKKIIKYKVNCEIQEVALNKLDRIVIG